MATSATSRGWSKWLNLKSSQPRNSVTTSQWSLSEELISGKSASWQNNSEQSHQFTTRSKTLIIVIMTVSPQRSRIQAPRAWFSWPPTTRKASIWPSPWSTAPASTTTESGLANSRASQTKSPVNCRKKTSRPTSTYRSAQPSMWCHTSCAEAKNPSRYSENKSSKTCFWKKR